LDFWRSRASIAVWISEILRVLTLLFSLYRELDIINTTTSNFSEKKTAFCKINGGSNILAALYKFIDWIMIKSCQKNQLNKLLNEKKF